MNNQNQPGSAFMWERKEAFTGAPRRDFELAFEGQGLRVESADGKTRFAPDTPSHQVRFTRALNMLELGGRHDVKAVRGPEANGKRQITAIAKSYGGEFPLEYNPALTARLRTETDLDDCIGQGAIETDPEYHPIRDELVSNYDALRGVVGYPEVSACLHTFVTNVNGIRCQSTGHVYFIPRQDLSTFRDVVNALKSVGAVRVTEMTLHTYESVIEQIMSESKSLLIASNDSLEENAQAIREAGSADGKTLGRRALRTMAKNAAAQERRLAEYARMFGFASSQMQLDLVQLQASINEAEMMGAEGPSGYGTVGV